MDFFLLGPLDVRDGGETLNLGRPKQRAVLALLLVHANRVVSVERMLDELWDGMPPASAVGAIHANVSMLRRILEPNRTARAPATVLVSQAPGYMLRVAPEQLDAFRFEHLVGRARALRFSDPSGAVAVFEEALALWRGEVLQDLSGEPWVAGAAVRLNEARLQAEEERFAVLVSSGADGELIPSLEAAVTNDPLRERLWALLMVALYRSGRQAEALRTYQRARDVLADELGLEPGAELQRLEQQILAHDVELEEEWLRVAIKSPVNSPEDSEPADVDPFVGRRNEQSELVELLQRVESGRGAAAVISGPAGIGKTKLIETVLRASPFPVAWGRSIAEDAAPSLWPWMQVGVALGSRGAALDGQLRSWVATGTEDAGGPGRAARVLAQAVERASAGGPFIIVIDDAQWADESSLRVLRLLIAGIQEHPIGLIIAIRSDEPPTPEATALLAAVASSPAAVRVDLAPLDHVAVRARVAAELDCDPDEELVDLLIARSGGNPFFLTEILRMIPRRRLLEQRHGALSEVPQTVQDAVRGRLARLPEEASGALKLAAVMGSRFDWRRVAKILGKDASATLDLLDTLTVHGLIVQGDTATRFNFEHDLIRESVYASVPVGQRAQLHAKCLIEMTTDADDPTRANELARHAWEARLILDAQVVVARLLRTAEVAVGRYDYGHAHTLLMHAAELTSRHAETSTGDDAGLEVAVRLGHLASLVHGYEAAETREAFAEARELHLRAKPTVASPSTRALAELAAYAVFSGDLEQAAALAQNLIRIATTTHDGVAACAGHSELALVCWVSGRVGDTLNELEAAIAVARAADRDALIATFGVHPLANLLSFLALAAALAGDALRSAAAMEEATPLARVEGAHGNDAWVSLFSGWRDYLAGDTRSALVNIDRYRAAAAKIGMKVLDAQADLLAGWATAREGDVAHGLELLRAGREAMAAVGEHGNRNAGAVLEAGILIDAGEAASALVLLDDALLDGSRSGEGLLLPELHRQRGLALEQLGAVEQSTGAYHLAVSTALAQGAGTLAAWAYQSLGTDESQMPDRLNSN